MSSQTADRNEIMKLGKNLGIAAAILGSAYVGASNFCGYMTSSMLGSGLFSRTIDTTDAREWINRFESGSPIYKAGHIVEYAFARKYLDDTSRPIGLSWSGKNDRPVGAFLDVIGDEFNLGKRFGLSDEYRIWMQDDNKDNQGKVVPDGQIDRFTAIDRNQVSIDWPPESARNYLPEELTDLASIVPELNRRMARVK